MTTSIHEDVFIEPESPATDAWNTAVRVAAMVAAAVPTVVGSIALLRIDWSESLDSPGVQVNDLWFSPEIALLTAGLGLIALFVAASASSESKAGFGVFLAILGVAMIVLSDETDAELLLQDKHGWMMMVVGGALILSALVLRSGWVVRRTSRWITPQTMSSSTQHWPDPSRPDLMRTEPMRSDPTHRQS